MIRKFSALTGPAVVIAIAFGSAFWFAGHPPEANALRAGYPAPPGGDSPVSSLMLSGTATALEEAVITRVSTSLRLCAPGVSPEDCAETGGGRDETFSLKRLVEGIQVMPGQEIFVSVEIRLSDG